MDIDPLEFASLASSGFSSGQSKDASAAFAQLLEQPASDQGPRWIPRASALPEGVAPVAADVEPEYFLDHVVAGHKEGLPVIEETPEEEAKAVENLLGWANSRGQDPNETTFIKGNIPVFDATTGSKIGYRIVTAMSLPMPPLCAEFYDRASLPDF